MQRVHAIVLFLLFSWVFPAICHPEEPFRLPEVKPDPSHLYSIDTIHVNAFSFTGNAIIPTGELKVLVRPYEGRTLTPEELLDAMDKVTRYYIGKGFINSGAFLPDQEVTDGIVRVKIVEGKLTRTYIHGNRRLNHHYIASRLQAVTESRDHPLNIREIQEALKILRQDSRIENIDANILPGQRRGEAELDVRVIEARPWKAGIILDNHSPPGIGSYQGRLEAGHINLTGWGDTILGSYSLTEGLDEYSVNYSLPLTRKDMVLSLDISRSKSLIVSDSFRHLDIRGNTRVWSVSVRQPVFRTVSNEIAVGLGFEHSRNRVSLKSEGIFLSEGYENGECEVSIVRFFQEWIVRRMDRVTAVRSTFTAGIDVLGATRQEYGPDGEFFTWLGEFQTVKRLGKKMGELFFRCGLRLSDSPLLSLEKFALGGSGTVRGYRENAMTTDSGLFASFEHHYPVGKLKIPFLSYFAHDGEIQIVPFTDIGRGWNRSGGNPDPDTILSIGMGTIWKINDKTEFRCFWGYPLTKTETDTSWDLQDDGFHISFAMAF